MLDGERFMTPQNAPTGAADDVGLVAYSYGESLCSQKMRVALAEKQLPYLSRHVYICDVAEDCQNLSPEYLKVNPKGIVPTLTHNGEKVFDAHKIIKYLDDHFTDSGERLWPSDPEKAAYAQYWFEHGMLPDARGERPNFASAIATVSLPLLEHMLRRQPLEHVVETYKSHPLPERRALFTGLRTGERRMPPAAIDTALDLIVDGLVDVETQLNKSGGPFVLGGFSIVDITMMACFHRLEDVHLQGVFDHPSLTKLKAYWTALQERASYKTAIVDWHDEVNWRSAIVEVFADAPSPHLGAVLSKIDARLSENAVQTRSTAAQ